MSVSAGGAADAWIGTASAIRTREQVEAKAHRSAITKFTTLIAATAFGTKDTKGTKGTEDIKDMMERPPAMAGRVRAAVPPDKARAYCGPPRQRRRPRARRPRPAR